MEQEMQLKKAGTMAIQYVAQPDVVMPILTSMYISRTALAVAQKKVSLIDVFIPETLQVTIDY